jgi:hypothetical protein
MTIRSAYSLMYEGKLADDSCHWPFGAAACVSWRDSKFLEIGESSQLADTSAPSISESRLCSCWPAGKESLLDDDSAVTARKPAIDRVGPTSCLRFRVLEQRYSVVGKNGFGEPLVNTDLRPMIYIFLHATLSCLFLGHMYQTEEVSLSDRLLC